jgi:hypothetical protein
MIAVRVSPDHRLAIVASPRTSTITRGPTPRTTCSTIDASTTDVVQGEVYRWHQRREPFQPRTCTSEGRKDTSKPAPLMRKSTRPLSITSRSIRQAVVALTARQQSERHSKLLKWQVKQETRRPWSCESCETCEISEFRESRRRT